MRNAVCGIRYFSSDRARVLPKCRYMLEKIHTFWTLPTLSAAVLGNGFVHLKLDNVGENTRILTLPTLSAAVLGNGFVGVCCCSVQAH